MTEWPFDPHDKSVFLKQGPSSSLDMFEAEAEGLRELAAANIIRVPEVLFVGVDGKLSYLAMERLPLARATSDTEKLFGEQLAALHRHTKPRFGWHRDNTIGLTPQENEQSDDWQEFFRERRLGFQLRLASTNGYRGEIQSLGQEIIDQLPRFFEGHDPEASLLHGDLWGGNWGSVDSVPVIFDPAVHYGDRESDIAMTMLFGGFGRAFYHAYSQSWPLAPGHERRMRLYQLYHVLNHVNLFGAGYRGQAINLMRSLL